MVENLKNTSFDSIVMGRFWLHLMSKDGMSVENAGVLFSAYEQTVEYRQCRLILASVGPYFYKILISFCFFQKIASINVVSD